MSEVSSRTAFRNRVLSKLNSDSIGLHSWLQESRSDPRSNGWGPMDLDEREIKETEEDFRREGECRATWLAISFLMAREARSDPAFLTDIARRFDKELSEVTATQNQKYMDRIRVISREYFQLMVLTAEAMAKESDVREPLSQKAIDTD